MSGVIVYVQSTPAWLTAVIAAAGAIVGGVVGSIGTYFVTRRSINAAKEEGDRQRVADKEMAAEERIQQRIETAYVVLQLFAHGWVAFAQWRIRAFETDPPTPAPELPTLEKEAFARAQLQASQRVSALVDDFYGRITYFRIIIGNEEWQRHMVDQTLPGSADEYRQARERLTEAGQALIEAGDELHDAMREELGSGRLLHKPSASKVVFPTSG